MPDAPSPFDDPFADLFGKLPDPRERRSTGDDASRGTAAPVTPAAGDSRRRPLRCRAARRAKPRHAQAAPQALVDAGGTRRDTVALPPAAARRRAAPAAAAPRALARRDRRGRVAVHRRRTRRARPPTGAAARLGCRHHRHRSTGRRPQPSRICSAATTRPIASVRCRRPRTSADAASAGGSRSASSCCCSAASPAARSTSGTRTRTRSARSWAGKSPRTTTPGMANGEAFVTIASGDTGCADLAEPVRRGGHEDPGGLLRLPDRHGPEPAVRAGRVHAAEADDLGGGAGRPARPREQDGEQRAAARGPHRRAVAAAAGRGDRHPDRGLPGRGGRPDASTACRSTRRSSPPEASRSRAGCSRRRTRSTRA